MTFTMPTRFQKALENRPAFGRLGDVTVRYDASLLLGEADRPKRTWAPVAGLCVAAGAATSLIAAAIAGGSSAWLALSCAALAGGLGGAAWLEQRDRRQRRFVLNFATYALRLDFSTRIAGKPKTMVVDFDRVCSLDVREQGDGRLCLTLDFEPTEASPQRLREVLVAHVEVPQREELERLARVLHDAFDLDRDRTRQEPPADPPPGVGPPHHGD